MKIPFGWLAKQRTPKQEPVPEPELYLFTEAMQAPEAPRTVAQQARHLDRFAPFVRRDACDMCASYKLCAQYTTRWRHGQRLCEDCLDKLHEMLIRHDV